MPSPDVVEHLLVLIGGSTYQYGIPDLSVRSSTWFPYNSRDRKV
jgi:hypothetical protein